MTIPSIPPAGAATTAPVAIIGGGPIGLAAAAHLAERGQEHLLLEAGPAVGAGVAEWGHIRMFSPWSEVVDPAAVRLLAGTGWSAPNPDGVPTGRELLDRYLVPLADVPDIAARTRTDARVVAVTRAEDAPAAPFVLRVRAAGGGIEEVRARAVIDASGTTGRPNRIGGAPDWSASGADRVLGAFADPLGADRARLAGRRVAVVGSGHSAAAALLALAALADEHPATDPVWVIRTPTAARLRIGSDERPSARAALVAALERRLAEGGIRLESGFAVARLEAAPGGGVDLVGTRRGCHERLRVDAVVQATGFRPDLGALDGIRLDLDETLEAPRRLAPLIDPAVHTCGTVASHGVEELRQPEPGFFLAGMKSYGRAPTFLLATGYDQVRSLAAWLSGDASGGVAAVAAGTAACATAGACC